MLKEDISTGVIIGRFQVPFLHQVHKELIETVISNHNKTIIILGVSPIPCSSRNPLDFEARKRMILEIFPEVTIFPLLDNPSDEVWSSNLDTLIQSVTNHKDRIRLYGGRDSFIPYYHGNYKDIKELVSSETISGTQLRIEATKNVRSSPDFRAGVIWATGNQFINTIATVDLVIFDKNNTKVLLCQKKQDTNKWRFIGGFSDVESESYEDDAVRELQEETGIVFNWDTNNIEYLGSMKINDWRYRSEEQKIKTIAFMVTGLKEHQYENAKADDDIERIAWFSIAELPNVLRGEHLKLFNKVKHLLPKVSSNGWSDNKI